MANEFAMESFTLVNKLALICFWTLMSWPAQPARTFLLLQSKQHIPARPIISQTPFEGKGDIPFLSFFP